MAKIQEIKEKIILPEGVNATLENEILVIKGEKGNLSRIFSHPKINLKITGNVIEITSKDVKRKEKYFSNKPERIDNELHMISKHSRPNTI